MPGKNNEATRRRFNGQTSTGRYRTFVFLFGLAPAFFSLPSLGQSLEEALISAYATNATLIAAREELRAVNEQRPQALAGYRPSLSSFVRAGGDYEFTANDDEDAASITAAAGITLTQPLYRGGRTSAGVSSAESVILAQRERYRAAEQDILLQAANAYLDVLRDQTILDLSKKSAAIVGDQVSAFRRQLKAGAATKTDLTQGETRLARTEANLARVEATLAASRAAFVEVTGSQPERLATPNDVRYAMPPSLADLELLALQSNLAIKAAAFTEIAARHDVDVANGWTGPDVDLVGSVQYFSEATDESVDLDDDFAAASVELRLTLPLYEGTYGSRSRQSKRTADQRRAEVQSTRRSVERQAASAWEDWTSSRTQIERLTKGVDLAETALDGLVKEHRLGERTALDLLNGEQELLDVSIELARAKRDHLAARFQALSLLGSFTVDGLKLDTQSYDIEADFRAVRDAWF